jgi:hypothetical protein
VAWIAALFWSKEWEARLGLAGVVGRVYESYSINQAAVEGLPNRQAEGPLVCDQQEEPADEAEAGVNYGAY